MAWEGCLGPVARLRGLAGLVVANEWAGLRPKVGWKAGRGIPLDRRGAEPPFARNALLGTRALGSGALGNGL